MKIDSLEKRIEYSIVTFVILIGFSFIFLMTNTDILKTPTGNVITEVTIIQPPAAICNFTLEENKNLVSFHCVRSLTSREYLLESIEDNYTSIFGYNPNSIDSWESYNPSLPTWVVQDLDIIDNRKGYWLIMKNKSNFYKNGSVSNVNTVPLVTNWNLIGYPHGTDIDSNTALLGINGNYTIIMAYNSSTGFWNSFGPLGDGSLENISMDRGYWIYMTSNDLWNITW